MPRLVIRIALLGVIASAAACSEEVELSKLEAIKKEVCACPTAECGATAMKKLPVGQAPAQAATHREQATARAIVECLAKLNEPKAPAADEADEQAAAGSASPTLPAIPVASPSIAP
ncbi:MAG TPA: hypothetical protein VGM90_31975 [Kofleriaceae bacterium]